MITKLTLGKLSANCYIISNSKKNCVIIDAGDGYDKIMSIVKNNKFNVQGVLLTHGHFDHCMACKKLQDKGMKIYIHKLDADKLHTPGNLSSLHNQKFDYFNADVLIDEGKLVVGDFTFNVIHTPGHSAGGVAYVYEDNVFTGDTMFKNGFGRYDYYDGSYVDLLNSIAKLYKLKKLDFNFFYGH